MSQQATSLKERFNRTFWCEEISTFAVALDGDKEACQVRSSAAGHLLWTGIVASEHVAPMVSTLMNPASFSGWGIRTISATEAPFNPLSYDNGAVWPHDTALIAAGLCRYGLKEEALHLVSGLFEASLSMDLHRLPELFSGLSRQTDEGPTAYPTACSPQAWTAAAPLILLQACLGLRFDGARREIHFDHPRLPHQIERLELRNLQLRDASVDLILHRHENGVVSLAVVRKTGEIEVRVTV